MEYLFEYLVFLAEVITLVVALLIIVSSSFAMSQRGADGQEPGSLRVTKLNDKVTRLRHTMEARMLPEGLVKKQHKQEAKAQAQADKEHSKSVQKDAKSAKKDKAADDASDPEVSQDKPRSFVVRFNGDIRASSVERLRLEVSAILTLANEKDEVIAVIESPGGMVPGYGLAASQLARIRSKGVPLTVAVDKVAASGGYMMAAVANKIIAAPFALVGSIGVVAQVPNVHRLLKKNDIDVEVLTAGKYKRTLTTLGENTEEGRQKFIEELEDVHELFQEFVAENRPAVDLDVVATGEAWYGRRAVDLGLVDEIATSDEYLINACESRDVYEIVWVEHQKPIDKILKNVNGMIEQASELMSGLRRQ
ncbi:MAG: protease SohB [Pseudomonadota bacterium]